MMQKAQKVRQPKLRLPSLRRQRYSLRLPSLKRQRYRPTMLPQKFQRRIRSLSWMVMAQPISPMARLVAGVLDLTQDLKRPSKCKPVAGVPDLTRHRKRPSKCKPVAGMLDLTRHRKRPTPTQRRNSWPRKDSSTNHRRKQTTMRPRNQRPMTRNGLHHRSTISPCPLWQRRPYRKLLGLELQIHRG